jgi:hypothetical protein
VRQEDDPKSLSCKDSHFERDHPKATHEKSNYVDSIFTLFTPNQIQENQDMRKPRIECLSQTSEDSRVKLEEPQVYARDLPQPFPKPSNDGTNLSTSMAYILQKVKRIRGMLEIPSLTKWTPDDQQLFEETSTLLQTGHFEKNEQTPFLTSLLIDDLCLHNCMLDSESSVNMMSLKVMNQLGLEVTGPYANVCRFESKGIKVYDLMEGLEVHLADYPDFPIIMDVIVVDIPDTWGMILSREWAATLGGSLQMDLSYATIPVGDQDCITLHNKPKRMEHIERCNHGYSNYNSVDPCLFQGWTTLPLVEEDNINEITWTKGKGDQNIPSNHKDNITQGNDETLHLHETYIRDSALVESHPIILEQERDTSWGDYPDDASNLSEDWDDYSSTQEDEIDDLIRFRGKGVGFVKWKGDDEHLLTEPNQEDVLITEPHPPPSTQYTGIQEAVDSEGGDYKQGDLVLEWDTKKGEPNNVKGNAQFWLGPFRIRMKSVNDAYYLSMLEGRKHPLPVSGCLLKPHHGAKT